jgi:1-acyl-sn-glycerol-3-phosphate acyltransferase
MARRTTVTRADPWWLTGAVPSADADVSAEAAEASADLNGAVLLRPRRRVAAGDGASTGEGDADRHRDSAGAPTVTQHPDDIDRLSSISREIPRLLRSSPRTAVGLRPRHLGSALGGTVGLLRSQAALLARRREDRPDVDELGFDRAWTESLGGIFRWLYHHYWRVRTIGIEHVPAHGRALLVANHAGVVAYDGAMVHTALLVEHPAQRHPRPLALPPAFRVPLVSSFLRRTGSFPSHPRTAQHLLERDELVLVFPEGLAGTGKPYGERYRLRSFGRGFARLALRTRSPIVPVSIVGSEEVHPMVANLEPLARLLGLPYVPVTFTLPWLGPLGLVPLPSSWIIEFHEPVPPAVGVPGSPAADEREAAEELAARVRAVIQAGVHRNLRRRGSVFA